MANTAALSFVVMNRHTGSVFAAFALPRDALRYVASRGVAEGSNGASYTINNVGAVPVRASLTERIRVLNDEAKRAQHPNGVLCSTAAKGRK